MLCVFYNNNNNNKRIGTCSQDGGIGKYTLPPCTTKRRTTTNLKTKNNQNCQKTELYGGPPPKELKKKHSSRLVGGVQMGSQGGKDYGKVAAGAHLCADKLENN